MGNESSLRMRTKVLFPGHTLTMPSPVAESLPMIQIWSIFWSVKEGAIMKLSTSVKPISYLKAHASRLIRELSTHQGTIVVTHNGQAKAVLQDIHTFEQTQETLALLKILTRSQQNVKQGRVKTIDETFSSLEARIRAFKNEEV